MLQAGNSDGENVVKVGRERPPAELGQFQDQAHWFALYTCASREKSVATHLASRGIEHFLPMYESVRAWSDRRVKLQLPLFPGYLFVHARLTNKLSILTVPGVVNLVGVAGRPAPLEAELIDTLREGLNRVAAQPYPYLPIGQTVSIRSGPLRGLSGILLRHKAEPRVVVTIDAIERSFLADVCATDLVPVGPILGLDSVQSRQSRPSVP